jgi:hypothetical protein
VIIIDRITSKREQILRKNIERLLKSIFLQLISSGLLSLLLFIIGANLFKNRSLSGGGFVQQRVLCTFCPSEFISLYFLQWFKNSSLLLRVLK